MKLKWNSNFQENPFENCRLPLEKSTLSVWNDAEEISLSRSVAIIRFTRPVLLSFIHSCVCSFVRSFVGSLVLNFVLAFLSLVHSFLFSFLSFPYLILFFIPLVNSFVLFPSLFISHFPLPSLIVYSNIHLSYYLLQFAAILDACSSAVVVWRFSGIAGQKYSFERERR